MRPPSIPQSIPIHEHDNKHIKIMKQLYNTLVEYREPNTNRIVIQLFISLPSRKDFPEYFNVIARPISMYEIKKRIEANHYLNEDSCVADFRLMFNNCRLFNEDLSQIFKDAVDLEELLMKRYKELTVPPRHSTSTTNNSTPNHTRSSAPTNNITINNSINSNHHSNSGHINHNNNLNNSHINNYSSNNINHNSSIVNGINNTSNGSINDLDISQISDVANTSVSEKPKRLKKDPDAPKRRLLTGYIIYAAEVRKEYVDKHPDQDFGFISRLIGNDWKALPRDLRSKYDQRALAHNKKIRERALRESMLGTPDGTPRVLVTPKMSKRKLAKMQEEMRLNQSSTPLNHDNSMSHHTPNKYQNDHPSQHSNSNNIGNSSFKPSDSARHPSLGHASLHHRHLHHPSGRTITVESSTQTAPVRFVEPPQKKRLVYSETFKRYIESMEVPNKDLLDEETLPERPPEPAETWLGAGRGRHESAEAALWALRDFMLQDVGTMRWSMQPYLCYL